MNVSPEMTPYELMVKRNIDENRRVLQSLGLLHNVEELRVTIPHRVRKSATPRRIVKATNNVESFSNSTPIRTRRSSVLKDSSLNVELDSFNEENEPPKKKEKVIHEPVFGEIKGVKVGDWWKTRMECSAAGVHRPTVAGIHGKQGIGCYSLALSGGYEDDVDCGDYFTYTGSGGRDLKGTKCNPKNLRTAPQSKDQVFDGVNAALAENIDSKNPVRVIRGFKLPGSFAPEEGYRYDGLYSVEKCWEAKGLSGFMVCKFALKRLPNQDPPPWTVILPVKEEEDGYLEKFKSSPDSSNNSLTCELNPPPRDHDRSFEECKMFQGFSNNYLQEMVTPQPNDADRQCKESAKFSHNSTISPPLQLSLHRGTSIRTTSDFQNGAKKKSPTLKEFDKENLLKNTKEDKLNASISINSKTSPKSNVNLKITEKERQKIDLVVNTLNEDDKESTEFHENSLHDLSPRTPITMYQTNSSPTNSDFFNFSGSFGQGRRKKSFPTKIILRENEQVSSNNQKPTFQENCLPSNGEERKTNKCSKEDLPSTNSNKSGSPLQVYKNSVGNQISLDETHCLNGPDKVLNEGLVQKGIKTELLNISPKSSFQLITEVSLADIPKLTQTRLNQQNKSYNNSSSNRNSIQFIVEHMVNIKSRSSNQNSRYSSAITNPSVSCSESMVEVSSKENVSVHKSFFKSSPDIYVKEVDLSSSKILENGDCDENFRGFDFDTISFSGFKENFKGFNEGCGFEHCESVESDLETSANISPSKDISRCTKRQKTILEYFQPAFKPKSCQPIDTSSQVYAKSLRGNRMLTCSTPDLNSPQTSMIDNTTKHCLTSDVSPIKDFQIFIKKIPVESIKRSSLNSQGVFTNLADSSTQKRKVSLSNTANSHLSNKNQTAAKFLKQKPSLMENLVEKNRKKRKIQEILDVKHKNKEKKKSSTNLQPCSVVLHRLETSFLGWDHETDQTNFNGFNKKDVDTALAKSAMLKPSLKLFLDKVDLNSPQNSFLGWDAD